jgi:hypothetical protein
MKVVERIWDLEFVVMEDLLPAPRTLRLAEQAAKPSSLQESLFGALNQFQATQQHRAQRRVTDVTTWVRYFTLYMAVLVKKAPGMVPSMVAHLHTVVRLHQRASHQLAWLEYDPHFRMELAATKDRAKQQAKQPRKAVCRLFNPAPKGRPYGSECIFAHRCTSCGVIDDHGLVSCRSLLGSSRAPEEPGRFQGHSFFCRMRR